MGSGLICAQALAARAFQGIGRDLRAGWCPILRRRVSHGARSLAREVAAAMGRAPTQRADWPTLHAATENHRAVYGRTDRALVASARTAASARRSAPAVAVTGRDSGAAWVSDPGTGV